MGAKTQQIQVRVTPAQKAAIRASARKAGLGLSAYVLARALPTPARTRFLALVGALRYEERRRFALAELNDLLTEVTARDFSTVVEEAPIGSVAPYYKNYLAALVEQAASRKGETAPEWLADIEPLAEPHFATDLKSLRPHLLRTSPVPFRRRNIFVDSALGDRV